MLKSRIGIVGFGRVGRNLVRIGYNDPELNFVFVSDFAGPEALQYLLNWDTIYGRMVEEATLSNNCIQIGAQKIRVLPGINRPDAVPWDALGVDVIIESTGRILPRSELEKYIHSGVKRVIITLPTQEPIDRLVVMGLNDAEIKSEDKIISPSSSTTQVLALLLDILDRSYGVEKAMMTTIHAYTSDQPLSDSIRSDLRRSRSAVKNIIPNKTPSPELVEEILPHLKGKLEGVAFNVPVPDSSCVDLTTGLHTMPTVDEFNAKMREISNGPLGHIIGYTDDPIVSSDVVGDTHSMVFDAKATMITFGKLLKTICWYDNGYGYSSRILELVKAYTKLEEHP